MNKNVRYEAKMRDRAKAENKYLVTISVDGKHLGDDSCLVQALVSLERAKELTKEAVDLLSNQQAFENVRHG